MIEAAIVYPLAIVILAFFLYILLLCAQKAQVTAAAENTMIYLKHVCSGNYDLSKYKLSDGCSELPVIEGDNELYNVYSKLFDTANSRVDQLNNPTDANSLSVEKIFKSYLGTPLLNNIEDMDIKVESHNYVLFTQVDLTVTYSMKQVLNFSLIGGESFNRPKFTVHVKGVISSPVETVRNLQFLDYVGERTGLTDKLGEIIGKVKDWFGFS